MQARQSAVFAEMAQRPVLDDAGPQTAELEQAVATVAGERVAEDLNRILTGRERLDDKQVCESGIAGGTVLYRLEEPYRARFAAVLARSFAALE